MNLPTLKVERLYRQISNLLIERIKQGQFPPGQALPSERDLSQQLGVSRSSVREALIALEISGWVEIRTGTGVFVKTADPGEAAAGVSDDEHRVEELLRARALIESELAALAATEGNDEQRAALQKLMDDMQRGDIDNSEFHALDKRFHLLIGAMTGNSALADMVETLWNKRYSPMFLHFESFYAERNVSLDMANDHMMIAEAILARNADAARKAMRAHLRHAYMVLFDRQKG